MKYINKDYKKLIDRLRENQEKRLTTDEGDARIFLKRLDTGERYRSHKKRVGDIANRTDSFNKLLKTIDSVILREK